MSKNVLPGIALITALVACQASPDTEAPPAGESTAGESPRTDPREGWDAIVADSFGFDEHTKSAISLDELVQGCPRVDCIPAIDEPKFLRVDEVDFIANEDLVIALSHNGETRAYAANILNSHEIVNDTIGGTPIAVTWCPLCGSGMAFERTVGGEIIEFGVSGVLHNSDLVLYDRATRSLWSQILSQAIVGPRTGERLKAIPVTLAEWGQWKAQHPDAKVLSTDTGYDKDYDHNRYAEYKASEEIKFPVSRTDKRLHVKKVVFGISVGDADVAYTEEYLRAKGSIRAEIDRREIEVTLHDDGSVTAVDINSGEKYLPVRLFWFAWYTFHPDSLLITGSAGASSVDASGG